MGDAPQHAAPAMAKPHLNDFVPGGDHMHLAAAIGKKFAFRNTAEWCCAVVMGMMFVFWAFKTVYSAPKSMPPEYKRYQEQAYQRRLLVEVEKQRQLRQRKATTRTCTVSAPAPLLALSLRMLLLTRISRRSRVVVASTHC